MMFTVMDEHPEKFKEQGIFSFLSPGRGAYGGKLGCTSAIHDFFERSSMLDSCSLYSEEVLL